MAGGVGDTGEDRNPTERRRWSSETRGCPPGPRVLEGDPLRYPESWDSDIVCRNQALSERVYCRPEQVVS